VVDVLVLGNQMDVEDANVDAQSGLAVPVEVVRLSGVRHVVGRLEVACVVQVLAEHVARHLYFEFCRSAIHQVIYGQTP